MKPWQHLLLAVDLTDDSASVCAKAMSVAHQFSAKVTLLHVVEYRPLEPVGEALMPAIDIEQPLVDGATERLQRLAMANGLEDAKRLVRVGNTKSEIIDVANQIKADLIVLGAHERHGLAMLINHTGDTMLHAAPCDVLAVRLPG